VTDYHSVSTGSGAHAAFCSTVTGGSYRGVKQPRLEATGSPSSVDEVKIGGAVIRLLVLLHGMMLHSLYSLSTKSIRFF
jgi:hypothetical protein